MVRSECYEFLKTVQKPTLVAEDADKVLNEHLRLHMLGDSTVFDTDLPERMKNTALPLKAYLETCKNKYQIKFYASTYVFTIGGLCDFIRGKRLRLCPKTCYYDKRRELLKPSVDAEFKALH